MTLPQQLVNQTIHQTIPFKAPPDGRESQAKFDGIRGTQDVDGTDGNPRRTARRAERQTSSGHSDPRCERSDVTEARRFRDNSRP